LFIRIDGINNAAALDHNPIRIYHWVRNQIDGAGRKRQVECVVCFFGT